MEKPKEVNILGKTYKIEYVKKPSDVDIFKRKSLWGQIDYWSRTIRIFDDGNRTKEDIWETIIHEIIYGIATTLNLKLIMTSEETRAEETVELLGIGLVDTLIRNGWLRIK